MKVKNISWIVASLLGFFIVSASVVQAVEYSHTIEDKKMTFSWKVEGEKLAVKITAKTEGWVGIGFNPSEKMKDANFVLGYVKKGKAKLIDEFGKGATTHKSDKKLGGTVDAELVAGTEDGGVTSIEFTMPLKSSDKFDTDIDVNADTIVLLAYGAGRDSFKSKHKYRSTFKVNLSTGVAEKIGKK